MIIKIGIFVRVLRTETRSSTLHYSTGITNKQFVNNSHNVSKNKHIRVALTRSTMHIMKPPVPGDSSLTVPKVISNESISMRRIKAMNTQRERERESIQDASRGASSGSMSSAPTNVPRVYVLSRARSNVLLFAALACASSVTTLLELFNCFFRYLFQCGGFGLSNSRHLQRKQTRLG
jgi:hypothetical protein